MNRISLFFKGWAIGLLAIAAGSCFGDLYEVSYTVVGDEYGNYWVPPGTNDMGHYGEIHCNFLAITSAILMEVTVSEGGFTDEKFHVFWSDGVKGTVTGGRTRIAKAQFCAGDTPTLHIYDGGTWKPPTNTHEYGADIAVSYSVVQQDVVLRDIVFSEDVVPVGGRCRAKVVADTCDSSDPEVKWSVSGVAGCTISQDGWIDVGTEEGTLMVRATLASDSSIYVEGTIKVKCVCTSEGCGGFGGFSPSMGSIDVLFGLGTASAGESAGYLHLEQEEPSLYWSSPAGLTYSMVRDDVTVLRDNFSMLRQLKSPEGLVDLVVVDDFLYYMNYYTNVFTATNEAGFYITNGAESVVSYRIENPGRLPGTGYITNLLIVQSQGGSVITTKYSKNYSGTSWTLSQANGLRIETLAITKTAGLRIETQTVTDASGTIASQVRSLYQTNTAWGDILLARTEDPQGLALCTSNTYDMTNGLITRQTYPDGGWREWTFDDSGRIMTERTPWGTNSIKTVTNVYSSSGVRLEMPRTIREYVDDHEVRYTECSYSTNSAGETTEVIQEHGEAGITLTTTNIYLDRNGTGFSAGKLIFASYPNGQTLTTTFETGTVSILDYPSGSSTFTTNGGSAVRETTTHGTKSSPAGVAYKTLREVRIYDSLGRLVSEERQVFDGSAYSQVDWRMFDYDSFGHVVATYNSDGTYSASGWSLCCGKEWDEDRTGARSFYTYDDLRRVLSETRDGITRSFQYDAEGRVLQEVQSAGAFSLTNRFEFNRAGQMTNQIDQAGLQTTWTYQQGGLLVTKTLPGGGTEIAESLSDGKTKSVTGTGATPVYYAYEADASGKQWTYAYYGMAGAYRTARAADKLGRESIVREPASGSTTNFYDSRGLLVRTARPLQANTLFEYNELGELSAQGVDVSNNGTLDRGSMDLVSEAARFFEVQSTNVWETERTVIYPVDNSSQAITNSVLRQRRSGWSGGLVSERESVDIYGKTTRSLGFLTRSGTGEVRTVSYPDSDRESREEYTSGRLLLSVSRWGVTNTFQYDDLGRKTTEINSEFGATTFTYNQLGQVQKITDPSGAVTGYGYEPSTGRLIAQTNAMDYVEYSAFDLRGNLTNRWGTAVYPTAYAFDDLGRMAAMTLWRDDGGSGDVTLWNYDPNTGLLTNKVYADGQGPAYTYTGVGQLSSRTWARGVSTLYSQDSLGQVTNINYSDATPDISLTFDRMGRVKTVTDATGTRTNTYSVQGMLLAESTAIGTTLNRVYDSFGRPSGLSLGSEYALGYAYNSGGQFAAITAGVASVTSVVQYAYLPNSTRISQHSIARQGSGSSLVTARIYETNRNLLVQYKNAFGGQTVSQFDYQNNALGQRTRMTMSGAAMPGGLGGSYWDYSYDSRGQVVGAIRRFEDGSVVLGLDHGYEYDDIGNRVSTAESGRTNVYQANQLNQYTQRTVQGWVNLRGNAEPQATVTLNNLPVDRRASFWTTGRYFTNTAADVWAELSAVGVLLGGATNGEDIVAVDTGHVFVARTPEVLVYDADGNLTQDARFRYDWDAENRMTLAETRTNLQSATPRVRLTFAYDNQGRRIRKTVETEYFDSVYLTTNVTTFVWNDWNPILEVHTSGFATQTVRHVWGLDISGTLQGAGGVGGLISTIQEGISHLACADASGNITEYLGTNGSVVVHLEFDAFGNSVALSGTKRNDFSLWFSSKQFDEEIALIYMAHRYYSSMLGRFLSRDPLEETDGPNLYAYVRNSPLATIDPFGQSACEVTFGAWSQPPANADADGYCLPDISMPEVNFDSGGCSKNMQKIAGYSPRCRLTISFAPGVNPDAPTAGNPNRSLREHELLHAKYFNHYYSWYTTSVEGWVGKCVCNPCAQAFVNYMNAIREYLKIEMDFKHNSLDCSDWNDPRRQSYCNKAAKLQPQLAPAYSKAEKAHMNLRGTCGN